MKGIKIKLVGSLPNSKLNFRAIFKAELKEVVRLSAKKYVRAATARVPKLTGMARGSFLPLSDRVGTRLKGGPPPKSIMKPKGQSFARGRALSSFEVSHKKFEWVTRVPYFKRHDRDIEEGGQGWRTRSFGVEAFLLEFEERIFEADIPLKTMERYKLK